MPSAADALIARLLGYVVGLLSDKGGPLSVDEMAR